MEAQAVRTLQKKRTSNFREDETKLLIQLWGSPFIQKKLYLTHRKAPVMRILATNMQQRGFYRTPDEIKTRIRNLKCLYHRIKRSMSCGTGVGTIDPDWPHFKSMDAILNKDAQKNKMEQHFEEGALVGPRCEDIKQEVDIDINDDMESWATNDSIGSETSEEPPPLPICKPPIKIKPKEAGSLSKPTPMPTVTLPSFSLQHQPNNTMIKPGSVPFPLLILNSLQPQVPQPKNTTVPNDHQGGNLNGDKTSNGKTFPADVNSALKDLLDVQKENLNVQKQRLELEKQRLEFDRVVGSQLLTLVPVVGSILQRLAFSSSQELLNLSNDTKKRKRSLPDDVDLLKDSKILRTIIEQGIKKYMMDENDDEDKESEEDRDENSNGSAK